MFTSIQPKRPNSTSRQSLIVASHRWASWARPPSPHLGGIQPGPEKLELKQDSNCLAKPVQRLHKTWRHTKGGSNLWLIPPWLEYAQTYSICFAQSNSVLWVCCATVSVTAIQRSGPATAFWEHATLQTKIIIKLKPSKITHCTWMLQRNVHSEMSAHCARSRHAQVCLRHLLPPRHIAIASHRRAKDGQNMFRYSVSCLKVFNANSENFRTVWNWIGLFLSPSVNLCFCSLLEGYLDRTWRSSYVPGEWHKKCDSLCLVSMNEYNNL